MNVKEVLDELIFKFPVLKPIISNILSAEVKGKSLVLIYPDFLKSFEEVKNFNNQIDEYLWDKNGLRLEYFFKNYAMPHLPFPAISSKHTNKLLFIKVIDTKLKYTLINKRKLYDFFNSEKTYHPFAIHNVISSNKFVLFDLLEEILLEILPVLKEEYKYLHPIIILKNIENFCYFDILFENIFKFIEKDKGLKDIRRFVGVPCYSFIDYFSFFGVDNDS